MKKTRFYIAYGSNLNAEQMLRRCPAARVIGTSVIPDYELLFKGSKSGSYLTIEPSKGSVVPVGIWAVTEQDEEALDWYEGFPDFYYKADFTLPVNGAKTRCFAYIMHEDRLLGIPSDLYVGICLEGYRDFGFPAGPIRKAYEKSIIAERSTKNEKRRA